MPPVSFDTVFMQHPDGSLEPRQPIRVGGVSFGPGVRFSSGVTIAGIDFTLFRGHNLEVREENGIFVIESIYQ